MTIVDTESSRRLKQYIDDHADAKTGERLPLMFRGERKLFDVFKIPTRLLTYNVKNGRLRVDVLRYQRREGKEIDPWSAEGRVFLKDQLLAQKGKDELLASIDQNGQIEPGLATFDGTVLNANRRMAAIAELDETCRSHPRGRHEYLIAAILPPDVEDDELYQIEADLQFGFDYKVKYGPMNEMLKIREGSRFRNPEHLAAMLGKSEKEIKEKLEILELIDNYLVQIGRPEEYELVTEEETYSHFAELPALVKKLEYSGRNDDAMEKYMTLAFTLIKGARKHRTVRDLKDMCELPVKLENRLLELADSSTLKNPPSEELCTLIEDRMYEGGSYIKQEKRANAPLEIVGDLIARVEILQPKKDAPYRADLLVKLVTLKEKVSEKISILESTGDS